MRRTLSRCHSQTCLTVLKFMEKECYLRTNGNKETLDDCSVSLLETKIIGTCNLWSPILSLMKVQIGQVVFLPGRYFLIFNFFT